jgi:hypothetical protein
VNKAADERDARRRQAIVRASESGQVGDGGG